MSVRTFECSACGATVPYGRLSCPECGELLASVAGGYRRAPEDELTDTPASHADVESATGPVPEPPDEGPATNPTPTPTPMPAPVVAAGIPPDLPGAYVSPATAAVTGAYVPPGPISPAIEVAPAGAPAPARAWGSLSALGSGGSGSAGAAATGASTTAEPFDLRDPVRRAEAIGSVGVAGAAIAAAGFLLPWAATMIGASGASYVDQWGLAGPAHVLVVLGLVAVALLGVVQNPVPTWLRLGIPGVALGSLLVGLIWPYLFGPLGGRPGLFVSLVGALLLLAAGLLCLVADRLGSDADDGARHAPPGRPV